MKKRITTPALPTYHLWASVCLFFGLLLTNTLTANNSTTLNLEVTLTPFDAECGNANNGAITTIVSGGITPYTYAWSNGAVTPGIANLAPGTYTLTVTDNGGGTITSSATVGQEDSDMDLYMAASYETCVGSCDANASVNVTGGVEPLVYAWSSGGDFVVEDGLCAGFYTVTVTDANGCVAFGNIEVELSPEGIWLMTTGTDASCAAGNDGTAYVSVMTGVDPFTIEWSNGMTGANIDGLTQGLYGVTVTDANGCVGIDSVSIGEGTSTLELYMAASYETCAGSCDANASVNVTGGVEPLVYAWSSGGDFVVEDNLCAGFYTVTVTDATGCQAVGDIEVELSPEGIWLMTTGTDATCSDSEDGTAYVGIMTGVDPFTIVWSNGMSTAEITGLAAGLYTVTVTDANSCFAVDSVLIDAPEAIQINISNAQNAECDADNGSITIDVSGGTGSYTYAWSNGAVTPNLTGVGAGAYSLTVTDENDCTSAVGPITILEENCCNDTPIVESVVVIEASCNALDGSAIINLVGEESNYTFTWTPNVGTPNATGNSRTGLPTGSYTVLIGSVDPNCPSTIETFTVGSSNGPDVTLLATTPATCNESNGTAVMSNLGLTYEWCNGATGYNPTNLPAGECQVTITDPISGCVNYRTVVIDQFNTLQLDLTVNNEPACGQANGAATINVSGGSTDYSYEWNNGANTAAINGITSGTYCVTVTDNGPTGCVKEYCFTLNDNVPGAVVTITDPGSTTCIGTADASVVFDIVYEAGFVEPAIITINNEAGEEVVNGNLSGGTYCILVTDSNGCVAGSACFEVGEPSQIDLDIAIDNDCDPAPGILVTEVSGGTAPYTFDWADLPGSMNPMDRPDLEAGSYDLTMTDASGCSVSVNDLIVVDTCACPPLDISSVVVIESECGESIGQATVNIVNDDNLDLTYQWSSNMVVISNGGKTINNAAAGTYSVTVTAADQAYCNIIESFTIGNTNGPEASVTTSSALCGATDGSAIFSNADFNYDWSDGATGFERTDLEAGTYFVTITDPNDPTCFDVKTVVIEEVPSFTADANILSLPDCGDSNGSVAILTSVPGDYTYSWGGDGTADNLGAGVYHVTVTDEVTGCTATTSFVLNNDIPNTTIDVVADASVSCAGFTDGTIDYQYTLPTGFAQPAIEEIVDLNGNLVSNGNLSAGQYCVIIRDANGCISGSACIEVQAPAQIDVDVAVFNEDCSQLGSINLVEVIGGTGAYTYAWSANANSNGTTAIDLAAGTYAFTVTDANACEVEETVTVGENPDELTISVSPDTLICEGDAINISVDVVDGDIIWTDAAGNVQGSSNTLSVSQVGIYYVTVSNSACSATDSVQVSSANVNVQASTDNFACQGVPGQFVTIENLNPGDMLTFDWSPDELILGDENTATPELNTDEAGIFNLSVLVTNQYGCSTTEEIEVLVVEDVANPSVFNDAQCDGTIVDFSIDGTGNYTWFFDPNDPTATTVGSDVSYEYPIAGEYEVTVIIAPSVLCFEPDTITALIEVVEPPLSSLGFEIDITDCTEGSASIVLTDTSSALSGAITEWIWTTSNGQTSDESSINIEINGSQELEVNLVITTEDQCMDSISQIIPIDVVDVQINDEAACFGTSEILNPNGDNEYTYEWSPSEFVSDPNAVSPLVTANENTTFMVTVTNAAGCTDVDTVQYSVIEEVDLFIQSEGPEFCSGEAVVLNAESSNATDYTWTDADGNVLSMEAAFPNALPGNPNNPVTYYVTAELEGCPAVDSISITNFGIDLEIEGPVNACPGDTIFFSPTFATDIAALEGATFTWSGPGDIDGSNSEDIMVIADGSDSYTLEVENDFCSGSSTINLSVSDFSEAMALANPDTIFLSETSNLNVLGESTWRYEWNDDISIIGGDPNSPTLEVQPEETTEYMVTITDSIGCIVNRTVTVVVLTECEEPYIFFPNAFSPNGDGFNDVLFLRGEGVTEVYFAIFNRWGEKIFESNDQSIGWDGTYKGEELTSDVFGFYLRVRCGNGEEFYKQGNVSLFR